MNDPNPKPDWSDAVSQASEHVQAREVALEEAAEQQQPKSRGPVIAALSVLLVAVASWNVYQLLQPPSLPSAYEEATHLRFFVADAVDLIEDFRADEGRLPTHADLGDLLDEELIYEVRGEVYVVGMEGETTRVEYESTMPFEDWMAFGEVS